MAGAVTKTLGVAPQAARWVALLHDGAEKNDQQYCYDEGKRDEQHENPVKAWRETFFAILSPGRSFLRP